MQPWAVMPTTEPLAEGGLSHFGDVSCAESITNLWVGGTSIGKDGVGLWVRRGARQRMNDVAFAADAEALDAAASEER